MVIYGEFFLSLLVVGVALPPLKVSRCSPTKTDVMTHRLFPRHFTVAWTVCSNASHIRFQLVWSWQFLIHRTNSWMNAPGAYNSYAIVMWPFLDHVGHSCVLSRSDFELTRVVVHCKLLWLKPSCWDWVRNVFLCCDTDPLETFNLHRFVFVVVVVIYGEFFLSLLFIGVALPPLKVSRCSPTKMLWLIGGFHGISLNCV